MPRDRLAALTSRPFRATNRGPARGVSHARRSPAAYPSGSRGRIANPLFVGSNPTAACLTKIVAQVPISLPHLFQRRSWASILYQLPKLKTRIGTWQYGPSRCQSALWHFYTLFAQVFEGTTSPAEPHAHWRLFQLDSVQYVRLSTFTEKLVKQRTLKGSSCQEATPSLVYYYLDADRHSYFVAQLTSCCNNTIDIPSDPIRSLAATNAATTSPASLKRAVRSALRRLIRSNSTRSIDPARFDSGLWNPPKKQRHETHSPSRAVPRSEVEEEDC